MMVLSSALVSALFLASPGLSSVEQPFPVTLTNCGFEATFESSPAQAVTMNQAATEIMLALGLEGSMRGTAYLDDTILPKFKDAYESIPVLSDTYPSHEELLAVDPDFIYASYSSAFKEEYAGPRDELAELGIGSYVSPSACENRTLRPSVVTIEDVYGEIHDIATIFGDAGKGETLTNELQADLDEVNKDLDGVDLDAIRVFWFDSFSDDGVYAGACCGAPGMIMKLLGVTNVFEDYDGNWATVSWDEVVAHDPDIIVIVNASWDTAHEKLTKLKEPAFSNMTAVKHEAWVSLDFSYTTPNIRNVEAVRIIADFILNSDDGSSSKKKSSKNKGTIIIVVVLVVVVACVLGISLICVYRSRSKADYSTANIAKEFSEVDSKDETNPKEDTKSDTHA